MSNFGYKVGRAIGQNPKLAAVSVCLLGAFAYLGLPSEKPPNLAKVAQVSKIEPAIDLCVANQKQRADIAEKLIKETKYSEAEAFLYECVMSFSESDKALYLKAINLASQAKEKVVAEEAKEIKQKKRKEGVLIGMTQQDAIDSSWGKPNKINRTTTSNGVREQWVYGGNYLYFQNGILTTIQN